MGILVDTAAVAWKPQTSTRWPATADRVTSVSIENGRIVGLNPDDPVQVSYEEMSEEGPTGISHPHLLTCFEVAQVL